jgi:hypothetical protein
VLPSPVELCWLCYCWPQRRTWICRMTRIKGVKSWIKVTDWLVKILLSDNMIAKIVV